MIKSDIEAQKILCTHCGLLFDEVDEVCNRCGADLHQRKDNSLVKTFLFAISSLIFLIPANLLPIMVVTSLGNKDPGTIMGGVIYFFHHGAYGIGAVIFIASIAVPAFKLSVLFYLLYIVYWNKTQKAYGAMKYYRIISFIGKWSMLDIFVVALMVAMVQFKNLATINTGEAALAFALAVVMTMIATESFDPRLLWDKREKK